jgi:hypothetical protein
MFTLPKRNNHPHPHSEELRRTPKKAKFHKNGVVPWAFFRQAVENPTLFLQSVDHSQIGSEESAHSPSPSPPPTGSNGSGDQSMPTSASTFSPSGEKAARVRRFGWYSEALLRDCYTDLMQEINDEMKKRNKRIDSGNDRTLLLEIRG